MIISKELEVTITQSSQLALKNQHEFITLEHLMLALLDNHQAMHILVALGANIEDLRFELETFINEKVPRLPKHVKINPEYSLGVQYVLQTAAIHVQSAGKSVMDASHVLVSLFREKESHAVYFLQKQGISRYEVVRFISHGASDMEEEVDDIPLDEKPRSSKEKSNDILVKFCENITEKARQKKVDPLIGRQKELERAIHILSRRRKNNPIFIGDAGVGKTAMAHGLAHLIVDGKVPKGLKKSQLFSLDIGVVLAGTKYRGEFEDRLQKIIAALKKIPNAILFIDEIHTLIGAGSVSGSSLDASNLLKPILASGDLKFIGTTTYKEYRNIFEKDHALSRRFQKIEIEEPSHDECLEILTGLKKHYEEFHQVTYPEETLKACIQLSAQYVVDRYLPDKAIDVMDEAGAQVKLTRTEEEDKNVTVRDVEVVLSRMTKIPPQSVVVDTREKYKDLDKQLKLFIYGQESAVDQVVDAIRLAKAGLKEEDKPIGSFLFSGPTGVGKTELSKQLAKILGVEFIRFDMSEYMEKHTVSRLIGAPPGYVGYDQGGLLTDAIHRNPHCVLLLDEIEKAHEDLFNILLQVMDHATLTDNNGRKSSFREVILIMTTNTGARDSQIKAIGFEKAAYENKSLKAIEKVFSPEFRNRLSSIIQFNSLQMEQVEQIVEKMIIQMEEKLLKQKVSITLSPEARTLLAEKGYNPEFGARPIKRLIEEEITKPLSKEILFGKLIEGGHVEVDTEKDKIVLKYSAPLKNKTPAAAYNE